ncbi:MAG TPA: 5'/3'-nucleotidase SurE, partial [Sutterellaceae bacterium]|nr:5'/3'-nucleotidase SurE [Sutterellaceae bacterium]
RDSTQGTDFWATSHNYVSVTPLQVDMTNYGMLDTVRTWCNSFQS